MRPIIAFTACALFLGACGSSGNVKTPSFDELNANLATLKTERGSMRATLAADMPTTGTATYKGFSTFGATKESEPYMISETTIITNFSDSSVSGNLTNFRDIDNNYLPGTITLEDRTIFAARFNARMTGTLNVDGEDKVMEGLMEGFFTGTDAGWVSTQLSGTLGDEKFGGLSTAKR